MDTKTFLETILPRSGFIYIARIRKAKGEGRKDQTIHTVAPDADEAAAKLLEWDRKYPDQNIYYAMASYHEVQHKTKTLDDGREFTYVVGRRQDNVKLVKSIWLDLDVGKEGCYATRQDALVGLQAYYRAVGLPTPLIVSSGYGLHCYWVFTEAVSAQAWEEIARYQRAAWRHLGLLADPACDRDAARVLRAPGTRNKRNPADPKTVKVVQPKVAALPAPEIKRRLRKYVEDNNLSAHVVVDDRPDWLKGGVTGNITDAKVEYPDSFAKIAVEHCGQLRQFRETGMAHSEPVWYATLGVMKHFKDGADLAHEWSAHDPTYDVDVTQAKLDQWSTGPTTCARFKQINPDGCGGCAQTCRTPVQLGYTGDVATPAPIPEAPPAQEDPVEPAAEAQAEEDEGGVFAWPPGYGYNESTAFITVRRPNAEGVWEDLPLATPLFYPVEQIRTEDGSYALRMVVMVRGRKEEFVLPTEHMADAKSLARKLASLGRIHVADQKGTQLFMSTFMARLMQRKEAIDTYRQMGWHNNFKSFLLGDVLFTRNEEHKVVVAKLVSEKLAGAWEARGDKQEWIDAVDQLYNREHAEPYQFALCAAFAAPLHAILGRIYPEWKGIPFALTSEDSGYAKTTINKIACSIWLNPERAIVSQSTPKAVLGVVSAFNNVPFVLDEVTQYLAKPDELAELLYALSNGQPREGMTAGGQLRERLPSWCGVIPMTGNRKLIQLVTENKLNPEAVQMRVFEIDLDLYPRIATMDKTTEEFREHGERLGEIAKALPGQCHGVIGPEYIRWVMGHLPEVEKKLRDTAMVLGRSLEGGDPTKERFYLHLITAVIVGGYFARKLGYIKFSMNNLMKWCLNHLVKLREIVAAERRSAEDTLYDMLSDMAGSIVVTRNYASLDGRTGEVQEHLGGPLRMPIAGRYVLGGGTVNERSQLYLTTKAVRDWCRENGVQVMQWKREAIKAGIIRVDHRETDNGARKISVTRGAKGLPSIGNPKCFEINTAFISGVLQPDNVTYIDERREVPVDPKAVNL